jgi:hypothetical protein
MSPPETDESLVEAAATAWRERDASGTVRFHHAWHDLDEAKREEAFLVTRRLRKMESMLDPDGLSTTAKAVLARIWSAR